MSDVELLAVLPQILRSAEQVTRFAAEWVGLLRERKISWSAIGNVLGVTESRVSQIHTKSVLQLRAKLAGFGR